MAGRKKTSQSKSGSYGTLITLALFVIIMAAVVVGTLRISQSADAEGVNSTTRAIERAAVLCYATEGYYPPSLDYLSENYGLVVDDRYSVRYEIFSPGITPNIIVTVKKSLGD